MRRKTRRNPPGDDPKITLTAFISSRGDMAWLRRKIQAAPPSFDKEDLFQQTELFLYEMVSRGAVSLPRLRVSRWKELSLLALAQAKKALRSDAYFKEVPITVGVAGSEKELTEHPAVRRKAAEEWTPSEEKVEVARRLPSLLDHLDQARGTQRVVLLLYFADVWAGSNSISASLQADGYLVRARKLEDAVEEAESYLPYNAVELAGPYGYSAFDIQRTVGADLAAINEYVAGVQDLFSQDIKAVRASPWARPR